MDMTVSTGAQSGWEVTGWSLIVRSLTRRGGFDVNGGGTR